MIDLTLKNYVNNFETLQCLIDNCSTAKILLDNNGTIIFINNSCSNTIDYKQEEIIGTKFYDHDEVITKDFWPHFWKLIIEKKSIKIQSKFTQKQNKKIDVHIKMVHLKNDNKHYALAYLTDLTKEKKLEEDLFIISNTFENSPIATYYLNMKGNILKCNQQTAQMLGYSLEELVGKNVSEFDVNLKSPEGSKKILEGLKFDTTENFIFTVKSTNDRLIKIKTYLKRVKHYDKEMVIGYSIDINEELKLKEKLKLMDFSLEHSKIASLITDEKGNILYNNLQALEMLKYSKEEMQTLSICDVDLNMNSLDNYNSLTTKFDCNLINSVETTLKRKDYSEFPAELYIKKLFFNNNTYFNINMIDITEKKYFDRLIKEEQQILENRVKDRTEELERTVNTVLELNQELKRNNAEKNSFLSFLSHEFKTPLSGILSLSEMLQKGIYGNISNKQQEIISDIKTSADHLNLLLRDLLDISQLEKGKIDILPEVYNVSDLINDSLPLIKHLYEIKNVNIEITIDKNISTVFTDKTRFKQILYNLLSNALKYSSPKDIVKINIKKSSRGKIKFSVSDNGPGIKPEHIENVFNEYYQADTKRDQKLGGYGLGLYLTRRLIELQRGTVGAENNADKGSNFWFILPIHPAK